MTRSDNGRGDPKPLTATEKRPDRDEARRRIEAATDHLGRLQQILLEMLGSERTAAPRPAPTMPGARLSRPALDQLAHVLGDPPLRNRPDLPWRGLLLVAGRDLPAGPETLPLRLRIDRNLRLCLDGASNRVAIEHLAGMHWRRLEICAQKDGHGGVTLDLAALERVAGPLSPRLTQLLQPVAEVAAQACPDAPPPCPEEG